MVFLNFLQKMSNEFELVLICVANCTPVVSILINEQPVINYKIIEELLIRCVKKKDVHLGLLATLF